MLAKKKVREKVDKSPGSNPLDVFCDLYFTLVKHNLHDSSILFGSALFNVVLPGCTSAEFHR